MFFASILSKLRTYRHYRQTIRDLMKFSDRELGDLGLSRYEIEVMTRQNAVS